MTVSGNAITGTLTFIEGGLASSGPLAGDGYFLALKWSDPDERATSLKVGLSPSSSGTAPVECIDDTDRNGVFKITPNLDQSLVFIQKCTGHKTKQVFDLSGLTFSE